MLLGKGILIAVIGLVLCDSLRAGVFPYKYATVKVAAVDEETGKPISKIKVEISYPDNYYFNHPKPDSATTDEKGIATIKIAKGTSGWNLSMKGKGYFPGAILTCDSQSSEITDQKKLSLSLKKTPKVKLILPNNYVGPITIDLPNRLASVDKNDFREEYSFTVDAKGNVKIDPHEIEDHWSDLTFLLGTGNFTAVYEDGSEIPVAASDDVKDSTLALRYVMHAVRFAKKPHDRRTVLSTEDAVPSRLREIYVLGTAQDQKALHGSPPQFETEDKEEIEFDVHDYNWDKTPVRLGNEVLSIGPKTQSILRESTSKYERIEIDFDQP